MNNENFAIAIASLYRLLALNFKTTLENIFLDISGLLHFYVICFTL